jgi:hypothetical protein
MSIMGIFVFIIIITLLLPPPLLLVFCCCFSSMAVIATTPWTTGTAAAVYVVGAAFGGLPIWFMLSALWVCRGDPVEMTLMDRARLLDGPHDLALQPAPTGWLPPAACPVRYVLPMWACGV